MKSLAAAAMVLAQLASTSPALAADLVAGAEPAQTRMGAFAGGRLRIGFGGRRDRGVRLGVAFAPVSRSQSIDGRSVRRFGDGFEFGIAGREPAALRLAGYRIGSGGSAPGEENPRLGVSTIEAAAIAAGVIVTGFLVVALAVRGEDD